MSLDALRRKTMLVLVLFTLAVCVFITVDGAVAAWRGYVDVHAWEDYRGQPVNSLLVLAVSACCIPIFAVFAYKMLTKPKFNWRGDQRILSQQQLAEWPRVKHQKRR